MDLNLQKKNFVAPGAGTVQHTLFEIILLLLVGGLFYWFIVSPKMEQVSILVDQREVLAKERNELEGNEQKLKKAIADMKTHSSEIADMDEALPLDNRVTKLYIALDSLTRDSGMTVGDISVGFSTVDAMAGNREQLAEPFKAKRTVQKLTTSLDVTGTYDQFQSLLQKLEESGRLINVSSIEITASTDDQVNFKINLEAYFYE